MLFVVGYGVWARMLFGDLFGSGVWAEILVVVGSGVWAGMLVGDVVGCGVSVGMWAGIVVGKGVSVVVEVEPSPPAVDEVSGLGALVVVMANTAAAAGGVEVVQEVGTGAFVVVDS